MYSVYSKLQNVNKGFLDSLLSRFTLFTFYSLLYTL